MTLETILSRMSPERAKFWRNAYSMTPAEIDHARSELRAFVKKNRFHTLSRDQIVFCGPRSFWPLEKAVGVVRGG